MSVEIHMLESRTRRIEALARMLQFVRAEARDLDLTMVDQSISVVEAILEDATGTENSKSTAPAGVITLPRQVSGDD